MRYLALGELIELHRRIIEQSGGAGGRLAAGQLERQAFVDWVAAHITPHLPA